MISELFVHEFRFQNKAMLLNLKNGVLFFIETFLTFFFV